MTPCQIPVKMSRCSYCHCLPLSCRFWAAEHMWQRQRLIPEEVDPLRGAYSPPYGARMPCGHSHPSSKSSRLLPILAPKPSFTLLLKVYVPAMWRHQRCCFFKATLRRWYDDREGISCR